MTTTEAHDKSHRDAIMKEAITRFLDDNDIEMTKQSAQKLQRNLALWFQDKDPISTSFIYNYLQETYEYHEHNIQQQQGLGTISDESPIINILINTDPRSPLSKSMPRIKKLFVISMFIAVCGLAGYGTLYSIQGYKNASAIYQQKINVTEAQLLKDLVKDISQITKQNGHTASANQIWRIVKNAPTVSEIGDTGSYKNFSRSQYEAAQDILRQLLKNAQEGQPLKTP